MGIIALYALVWWVTLNTACWCIEKLFHIGGRARHVGVRIKRVFVFKPAA